MNNYALIAADCPKKIPPSQAYQQEAETITLVDVIDPPLGVTFTISITTMTTEIGTDSEGLDLTPITLDIGVTVTVTLTEVALDLFTDPHATAHHATEAGAHPVTAETQHTTDPHPAGVSPEITVDPKTCTSKHHYKTPKAPIFQFT